MEKRKPVVLILDDVPENVKVLGSILGREKYSLLLASSGHHAIQMSLVNLPDILLLDVMVPDIDGISVCRYLKSFESFAHIPVIFLTANADPKDISLAYEAGGVDYVLKPFHSKEIRVRVETHLEIKRMRDRLAAAEKLFHQALSLIGEDRLKSAAGQQFVSELKDVIPLPASTSE